MFLCKHWAEVARIYCCIVAISPFGVDVPSSSERVGLSAQAPRAEADDEVKLGEIFRPSGLSAGKNLGSGKIFEVLVVSDNVNQNTGTFEVVSPDTEGLEDCK